MLFYNILILTTLLSWDVGSPWYQDGSKPSSPLSDHWAWFAGNMWLLILCICGLWETLSSYLCLRRYVLCWLCHTRKYKLCMFILFIYFFGQKRDSLKQVMLEALRQYKWPNNLVKVKLNAMSLNILSSNERYAPVNAIQHAIKKNNTN